MLQVDSVEFYDFTKCCGYLNNREYQSKELGKINRILVNDEAEWAV